MLPSNSFASNSFAYNFNGPSLNSFGQLSVHSTHHHHLENGQDHTTHLIDDNLQHNQLYELHPHQQTQSNQTSYSQSNLDNSNEELPVISLFKLKSFLNQPKKPTSTPMQSMFHSTGQELTSTSLQLLSSSNESNGKI